MFKRLSTCSDLQEKQVDLTPLIDVVFLLLIFFMVTSVFMEETGIEIDKPAAATVQQLENSSILLAISARNEIYFDKRQLNLNQVRGTIARLLRERERPVVLLADEGSRSGLLVQVIDECKLGGATQISVAADK